MLGIWYKLYGRNQNFKSPKTMSFLHSRLINGKFILYFIFTKINGIHNLLNLIIFNLEIK
jgi:hypothetical protein